MKTILNIIIIITLASQYLFAQSSLPNAEKQMKRFNYAVAVNMYLDHFKNNNPNNTDIRNVTFCYLKLNDMENAEKWLSKIIKKGDANDEDLTKYAEILKSLERYSEAKDIYRQLANKYPDKKEFALKEEEKLIQVLQWLKEDALYEVNTVPNINTEYAEFGIINFKDNKVLFSTDRIEPNQSLSQRDMYGWTGNNFVKMYFANINKNGELENYKMLEGIAQDFHNSPGYFDQNNNTLYFTRTKLVKLIQKPSNPDPTSWFIEEKEIYTIRLEIYSSKFENGKWGALLPFEHNNADLYSTGHPVLSPDGNVMYFVSDMPGSLGETDIFYSVKRSDGKWADPRNCGPKINTTGKEMFPGFDSDGNFYFSSNGHAGYGGLDIFKTRGEKNQWNYPENLKHPINSAGDDFALYWLTPGIDGYISSNRKGNVGLDDIFRIKYAPPLPKNITLVVKTFEQKNDEIIPLTHPINVHYHTEENINMEITIPQIKPGEYITQLDCNKKYLVHGTNSEFFAQSKEIFTDCKSMNDTIYVELVFERIVLYKPIVIENIYYDFDKWNIRPDAAIELDKIVTLLNENPHIIIELGSHTDSRGTFKYNEVLSQRRAESAVNYIISRGIDSSRITAKGYGEYQLVNQCSDGVKCTEEEHQMNRRTEFKVTGFSKEQPVIYSADK